MHSGLAEERESERGGDVVKGGGGGGGGGDTPIVSLEFLPRIIPPRNVSTLSLGTPRSLHNGSRDIIQSHLEISSKSFIGVYIKIMHIMAKDLHITNYFSRLIVELMCISFTYYPLQ